MGHPLDPLVLDLVEWVAKEPRSYAAVIDAWRTSCPRLTVWEDAVDRGLVKREAVQGQAMRVIVTQIGEEFLRENGRPLGTRH
jgi:hypothetical protein